MKKIIIFLISLFNFTFVKSQVTENVDLNQFVMKWIGTPYRFGGKTEKGIDCSKLTQKVYSEVFNCLIPGVSWEQWDESIRIQRDSLKTGDLVFFKSSYSPSGWHVGLYLIDGYFFHASGHHRGVTVSSLNEKTYAKNFKGAGRIIK